MSISYKPYNSYEWSNSKFLSSSEELIIQYAEKINSEESIQSTLKYLNKALAILEDHPYVFLNEGTNPNHFYKSDLKKIDLVIGAPQIIYGLESKNDKVVSSVKVVSNRKKYSISDKEVVRLHPHFVKIKECIYFLPNIVESSHFEAAQLVHNKIMVLSKMPDFIEKYLLNVLKKYDFEVSKNSPIKVKNKELKMKQKELYLSEVGGFIVFRPFIQYENDIRLNALTEKSEWTYKDKKLIQKKGDEVEVEEFKSLIKSLHPEFEQQLRSDYLHLRGTELLKNNMFFDFFKKLKEHNVKVFGLEKLSQLKVNPYPGKVSYSVKSGIDWFEVEASVVFGDAEISIEDLKKRFVPGSSYVELNDGTKGMLPDEWVKKLEKLFRHGNLKEGRVKISNKKFNLIDELFEELDDEISADIFEKKEKLIHFNGFKEQKVPKGIKAELRGYQKAGYSWLNFLKDFGWGGILADDMGLGKTLQAITFIKQIIATDKTPNLIIVPTSLLFNWKNELEKFAPSIKAHFYYGPQRDKDIQAFNKYHLIITSYGHLVSDIENLKEFEFNYVILDESQAIKNPASKRFKAARLLKAKNRVAMTGTPIENNTFDLYAQMSFLNPGFLGSKKHFKDTFAKAIDKDRDEEKANELQKMIKPFVLRRTKEQVATELPDKTEEVLYCEMDASQRKIYDSHRNEFRNKIISQIEEEGINKSRFMVLEGLTRLRQICDSPNILAGEDKYDGKSVKIDLLREHILEKTANHKILVFSQFVSMLNEIKRELDKHNIEYAYLDGKSSTKNREQNVANFQNQENCRVFLISLKAGGTGLNLMAADYVYIVDPWWNPAVENQAIDRCYRIGQKKNVIAYRMICKDTVEEKIVELQNKKKAIAGDIISTDEGVLKKLEKEDLMDLFS